MTRLPPLAPPPPSPRRVAPGLVWGLSALWLAALALALVGLGRLPLRDWDESLVARVALETSQRSWPDLLLPTLWGDPYLNKPPGLHLLIGFALRVWRSASGAAPNVLPPEWVVRLVPAVLSTTLVPLIGLVQARLRPDRPAAALASAAMALTLLPLARHGRLVMLDGCQLAVIVSIWWAALHPDRRAGPLVLHGALMGLGGSALLLLKAPLALPLLVGTLLLKALDRDWGARQWRCLLLGLALGLLPGLAWHGLHLQQRGADALRMWGRQGFARVAQRLEGHSGGPIMPITEVLEGGWPWLALWPGAMGLAWRDRASRAGRWCLGTTALSATLVLPLGTQLPWYSLLLWPPVLLCCGPVLVWLVDRRADLRPACSAVMERVPAFWALLGAGLCALAFFAATTAQPALVPLIPLASAGGVGLLVGGGLLLAAARSWRRAGAIVLVLGLWGALLSLMAGPLWLWELNEQWAVPPVAALVRQQPSWPAFLWQMEERPSLNWYAGRRLRRWEDEDGRRPPFVLISSQDQPPSLEGTTCVPLAAVPPVRVHRCTPEVAPSTDLSGQNLKN